ncbi:MAG TPA: fibronectin type III domain-containing protein, partial [Acidimicrobiales bacterium]
TFDSVSGFVGQLSVTTRSATVTGLTPGHTYGFAVYSHGGAGYSAAVGSNNVTLPVAGLPGSPTAVTAKAGTTSGTATITWTAGSGPAATSYLVQVFDSVTGFVSQVSVTTATATVTGLGHGHTYTFLVYGHNAAGYSPGAASNALTVR